MKAGFIPGILSSNDSLLNGEILDPQSLKKHKGCLKVMYNSTRCPAALTSSDNAPGIKAHPPYSPNLAPCDFHIFTKMKGAFEKEDSTLLRRTTRQQDPPPLFNVSTRQGSTMLLKASQNAARSVELVIYSSQFEAYLSGVLSNRLLEYYK